MKKTRYISSLVSLCILAGLGCATSSKRYTVEQEYVRNRDLLQQATSPVSLGIDGIRKANTVAFIPPDSCKEIKAAGGSTQEIDSVMRMRCGVIMSELERQAAEVGFEVVSWQQMGGGISAAKASRVDLLFEVNELSVDFPKQELMEAGAISFRHAGEPLPVLYPEQVAGRCAESFLGTLPPTQVATLDLKMVDVASERVGWFYRDSVAMDEGERYRLNMDFIAPGAPNGVLEEIAETLYLIGGLLAIPPVVTFLMVMARNGGPELTEIAWWTGSAAGASLTTGVLLSVLAHQFQEYPEPEQVLCNGTYQERISPLVQAPSQPRVASTVRLESRRTVNRDENEEKRRQLIKTAVQKFMQRLSGYR